MEFFFTVPDSSVEICNCALYPEMYSITAVDDDLSHSLIICFYYTEPISDENYSSTDSCNQERDVFY